MRYAVISDVHANVEALERALADARGLGVDEIVCLGDIVGYGPLPAEALALVRANCETAIAGNHDDAVAGRFDVESFNDLAHDAALRHRGALSREDVAYLSSLPYTCRFGEAEAAHGDFTKPEEFLYVNSREAAAANFAAADAPLLFVGHTHVPCVFVRNEDGTVERMEADGFSLERGKRYLVNPGSVGYPRDAGAGASSTYAIYDTVERMVVFRRLPFYVGSVMQRGAEAPAPRRARAFYFIFAALAIAALAAAGVAVWFAAAAVDGDGDDASVEYVAPALLIDSQTIDIPIDCRTIDPGLKLAKDSAPVLLQIVYLDGQGREVKSESRQHESRAGRRKIPKKALVAVKAKVSIYRMAEGDKPMVEAFNPCALP